MARRLILAAAFAVLAVACPAAALAATAPTSPPTLTTAPYVVPATFTWTPAVNGPDLLDPNTTQQVRRGDGVCPPGPVPETRGRSGRSGTGGDAHHVGGLPTASTASSSGRPACSAARPTGRV